MFLGGLLFAAGLVLVFADRLPFKLGRLPGDIVIRGKHSVFYFPLTTLILINLLIALVLWLIRKR